MGGNVEKIVTKAVIATDIAVLKTRFLLRDMKRRLLASEDNPRMVLSEDTISMQELPEEIRKHMQTEEAPHDSLSYACPHCRTRFSVAEDSEEYMVACPACGKQLDLTELNPL